MHFIRIALAVLSAHFSAVQAYQFSTAQICTTKYGTKSVSVKTTSYAITIPITVVNKFTTTPTITITPAPQTTTSTTTTTVTSTVVTTPTNTFTETTSTTSTATTTTTITTDTTTTVTTTSSIATSTVPTPAGFTPIASEPGYVPKKRFIEAGAAPAIHGRRIEERVQKARNHICPPVGNPGAFSKYPQKVTCGALVVAKTTSTKTYTATSTATTTLPPATSTVTSTVTTTETSTSAAAPASTTITITLSFAATTTVSSTTTTTATQTNTIVQAASTVYAACDANNVVNHANGNQGIFQVYYAGSGSAPTTAEVTASNAVSCCEQCQQTTGCTGYAQYPGSTRCFVFTQGQCDGSQNLGQFFSTSSAFAPSDGYTLGNGQCGQIDNGGSSG